MHHRGRGSNNILISCQVISMPSNILQVREAKFQSLEFFGAIFSSSNEQNIHLAKHKHMHD
jgi:hypothetical protein